MKPTKIFLVRHGESEGNVDYDNYAKKPDYQLNLTEKGKEQAIKAGEQLKAIIGEFPVQFYISPLWRTRQTFEGIVKSFKPEKVLWKEEPRIREQEWGHLRAKEHSYRIEDERNKFGTFYFRIEDGESCADVYDRMSSFFSSLHRDFEKPTFPNFAVNVAHGTSIRLFLMRWFHWTVEEFESTANPKNCEIFTLSLQPNGKYKLDTPLRKREDRDYMPPYNWDLPVELLERHKKEAALRFTYAPINE